MPTFIKIEHHQQTREYYFKFETSDAELWEKLVKECGDKNFDKDKPSNDVNDWETLLEQCVSDVAWEDFIQTHHSINEGDYDIETRMDDD